MTCPPWLVEQQDEEPRPPLETFFLAAAGKPDGLLAACFQAVPNGVEVHAFVLEPLQQFWPDRLLTSRSAGKTATGTSDLGRLDPGVDRGCLQPRQAAAENVTVLPGEFLGQRLTEE
jgi:hypothetical protein